MLSLCLALSNSALLLIRSFKNSVRVQVILGLAACTAIFFLLNIGLVTGYGIEDIPSEVLDELSDSDLGTYDITNRHPVIDIPVEQETFLKFFTPDFIIVLYQENLRTVWELECNSFTKFFLILVLSIPSLLLLLIITISALILNTFVTYVSIENWFYAHALTLFFIYLNLDLVMRLIYNKENFTDKEKVDFITKANLCLSVVFIIGFLLLFLYSLFLFTV